MSVGLQYWSAGYSPNRSCSHLAAKTEKHATFGSRSIHSLRDFAFQCPPHAHGMKSIRQIKIKYNENSVRNELNHEENKFCRIQPITPTSIKGGGEGGIDFSLTYA